MFKFLVSWSLKNQSLKFDVASQIVDDLVTLDVKQFFEHNDSTIPFNTPKKDMLMHCIHLYL